MWKIYVEKTQRKTLGICLWPSHIHAHICTYTETDRLTEETSCVAADPSSQRQAQTLSSRLHLCLSKSWTLEEMGPLGRSVLATQTSYREWWAFVGIRHTKMPPLKTYLDWVVFKGICPSSRPLPCYCCKPSALWHPYQTHACVAPGVTVLRKPIRQFLSALQSLHLDTTEDAWKQLQEGMLCLLFAFFYTVLTLLRHADKLCGNVFQVWEARPVVPCPTTINYRRTSSWVSFHYKATAWQPMLRKRQSLTFYCDQNQKTRL